jgi:hypothetical protein
MSRLTTDCSHVLPFRTYQRNTVFRSQYINDHLNPLWDEFSFSLEELCYGDVNWPIKVTVFDYNRNGVHKEIGVFETTIQEMSQRVAVRGNADREVAYELSNEDTNTNTAKTCGFIVVLQTEIQLDESSITQTSSFINNFLTTSTTATTTTSSTNQNRATTFRPDPPSANVIQANPNWQSSQPSLPTLHEF